MQHSGMEERTQAEAEYKAAQAKGYSEGTMDRMSGFKDSIMGSVKGDEAQKASGKSTKLDPSEVLADKAVQAI